jgi:hypothetical protein
MKQNFQRLIKRTLKATPLYSVYQKVGNHFRRKRREARERTEKKLPNVALSQSHIKHCELVLNRSALLSRLPNGGTVAEIGVARGDFSSEILSKTSPESLHLIDVWDSERYHQGLYETVQSRFEEEIGEETVEIHRGLSTEMADRFPDVYFDWVYIDTDHSYETTLSELKTYDPKIKDNGIIAGHDYSMGNWKSAYRYGVIEAVHEFCAHYDWRLAYLTAEEVNENRSFAIERNI